MRAIGIGCKKLKNLTLSDCYFLSDKGLEAIDTGCKELTHLEVNGCHNIGTLGLESVGKSCLYVLLHVKLHNYVIDSCTGDSFMLQKIHLTMNHHMELDSIRKRRKDLYLGPQSFCIK